MDTDQATGVNPLEDLIESIEPDEEATVEDGEAEASGDDEDGKEEGIEAEAPSEAEEVEFDGKKLAIPKGTPPALVAGVKQLAHDLKADYSRKTQEVAEVRRAVQAQAQAVKQQEEVLNQNFQKAVALRGVQDKLSQFEQIDWQSLAEQDTATATKLNLQYQATQREAQKLYAELKQGYEQQQHLNAQQRQQMLQQGEQEVRTRIPKFGPELAQRISKAAKEYGYRDDEVASTIDPRFVHVVHDAMQWRKLQTEKPKAMQKVADAPKAIRPQAPHVKNPKQEALARLRKTGRLDDFASLL